MEDINKKATFNFNIELTKKGKIRKSVGGKYDGNIGRPKGCKLINIVDRSNSNQIRFGHRKCTTSQNKEKDTPIKHGYHLEDYERQCVYEHYYNNENKPFYIGQGTLQRAFVFSGNRRNNVYNNYAKDINLIKVNIIAIDITPQQGIEFEKQLIAKYKFIKDGGSLVNIEIGGRGGSRGKGADNVLSKPVNQYTKSYQFIKQWASATVAAETLGFDASSISKCCRHVPKYNSHKGYIWEFAKD